MSAALEEALRTNAADLLAYFERRIEPRADAADLLSEVMLHAWRRRDDAPTKPEALRMWLFGIARHVAANQRRGRRRNRALVDRLRGLVQDEVAAPCDHALEVRDAVMRLEPGLRELIMLVHWDGFTVAEAAEIIGLNPSTARSRHAAGKAQLREMLGGGAPEPRTLSPALSPQWSPAGS